ncbi:unnamed protein product [Calypogeia fissa]
MSLQVSDKGRVAVLAFGTHGDVLPVAVVAAELAKSKANLTITFITHSAHKFLEGPLGSAGVFFHPISTAPIVLPPDNAAIDPPHLQSSETGNLKTASKDYWKRTIEQRHREECLLAVEQVFGQQSDDSLNFILFNFFALEGWHLAELYQVPCAVAAPYVVPYSAPASFERKFRAVQPLLYERLQHSVPGEVGWGEVMHWMWPLFTDRWTEWRSISLHLSACPLTDPVTELPISQDWPRAPPLLYGFSQAVVECPGYWPRSIHVCGFWYPPSDWEAMYGHAQSAVVSNTFNDPVKNSADETRTALLHCKLLDFLSQSAEIDDRPIFVGLSSIGSMGYLRNPETFLKVILKALDTLKRRAVLFTASYQPLDSVILADWSERELPSKDVDNVSQYSREDPILLKDGITLHNNSLFCFSGFVAYNWLFPKCSMVIHHGGSGTTAAALRSGVPQIICPFVLDQFYWAERMAWIGVAPEPLKPNHLCPSHGEVEFLQAVSAVVNAITEASRNGMRGRAAEWSQKICQEDGVQKFVQILSEQLSLNW